MRSIGVQVGLEGLLGALLEIVVFADELLQLGLHIGNLLGGELKLNDRHAGCLQMRQEADFIGLKEQQTAALGVGATSSSAHSVDIIARVVRRIELNDEVDSRNLSRDFGQLLSPKDPMVLSMHPL